LEAKQKEVEEVKEERVKVDRFYLIESGGTEAQREKT